MKKLSNAKRKRRVEIIKILTDMSRNWALWSAADWKPLETELAELGG